MSKPAVEVQIRAVAPVVIAGQIDVLPAECRRLASELKQDARTGPRFQRHRERAIRHHKEAAKHYARGSHEKAGHHADVAHGHLLRATHHAEEAAKHHVEEYGSK